MVPTIHFRILIVNFSIVYEAACDEKNVLGISEALQVYSGINGSSVDIYKMIDKWETRRRPPLDIGSSYI